MMDYSNAMPEVRPAAAPPPAGAIQFRSFLRGLAEEIDTQAGAEARDRLLRGAGHRMARLLPLPAVASMRALEMEMNDVLGAIGWGSTHLDLREAERCLVITHTGLPRIGSAGDPLGSWLSAALEGLYEAWLAQQPGSDPDLVARRQRCSSPDVLTLHYSRQ